MGLGGRRGQTNQQNKQTKQTNKQNKQTKLDSFTTLAMFNFCQIFFSGMIGRRSTKLFFSQKQGKHIRDQKVTTIARVKNLRNYMEKIANSKKEKLQHLKDGEELEVCLDLDAGGGRVVAEFGF